jgi:transposase
MSKRSRRTFTAEFKAEAVRLAKVGDRSIGKLAMDLGIADSVLREWIEKAQVDAPVPTKEPLADDERRELQELRREVRQLREDKEILKKAAAFFAKESR